MRIQTAFGILVTILMVVSILLVFAYAPQEKQMGLVQKIFYFHVPAAWNAFLAFAVTFVASIGYLWKRSEKQDSLAVSSAEIGLVFCTIVLVSGPIWAKGAWNTWWNWEPRLTTTLILWLMYAGYLVLRTAFTDERKRTYSAVLGILAFMNVPIVYFSVRWWGSVLHPVDVIKPSRVELDPRMRLAFFVSLFTFTLLYFYLLQLRHRIERMTQEADAIQQHLLRDAVRD